MSKISCAYLQMPSCKGTSGKFRDLRTGVISPKNIGTKPGKCSVASAHELTVVLSFPWSLGQREHMQTDIDNEVKRCAAEIHKISPASRVIVFGSSLDDKVRHPRDIDLLVVIPRSEQLKSVRRKILSIPRNGWPLDIIVLPADVRDCPHTHELAELNIYGAQRRNEEGPAPATREDADDAAEMAADVLNWAKNLCALKPDLA